MGVDAGGLHWNWNEWALLFDLGRAFGWKPAGTIKAKDVITHPDETVHNDYFVNDYDSVDDADARAWAAALKRALAVMAGEETATAAEAEALKRILAGEARTPTATDALKRILELKQATVVVSEPLPEEIAPMIGKFIDMAAAGGFMIG